MVNYIFRWNITIIIVRIIKSALTAFCMHGNVLICCNAVYDLMSAIPSILGEPYLAA